MAQNIDVSTHFGPIPLKPLPEVKRTWAQKHHRLIHFSLLASFCFFTVAAPLVIELMASPNMGIFDFLANLGTWRYLASSGLLTALLALFLETRESRP